MNRRLPIPDDVLARVCARHRIRRLSLFGSSIKGTDRPDSDVDLLVEFEPGSDPTLLDMAKIEEELSSLIRSRRDAAPRVGRGSSRRSTTSIR